MAFRLLGLGGMVLASDVRGTGFKSRTSPFILKPLDVTKNTFTSVKLKKNFDKWHAMFSFEYWKLCQFLGIGNGKIWLQRIGKRFWMITIQCLSLSTFLGLKKLIEYFSRVFNVKIKRILEIYLELIHCLGEDAT